MKKIAYINEKIKEYNKKIYIPGDKSLSIRFVLIASQAIGKSIAYNLLKSEDVMSALRAIKKLGINYKINKKNCKIYGKGLGGFSFKKNTTIDAGNSGTLARLISGILAVQNFDSSITGDESLLQRPMRRIIDPLSDIGALINSNSGRLPLAFAKSTINPIEYN